MSKKTVEEIIDDMIDDFAEKGVKVTARAREKAIQNKKNISLAKPQRGVIGHKAVTRALPRIKL